MIHLLLLILLTGCATFEGSIEKTPNGVIMKANKDSIMRYKEKDWEAELDSKNSPLINIGIPDVKVN